MSIRMGTVHLNHGGTEMGQGLFIKVAQVVADELGVGMDRIRLNPADTAKIPNASATAASSGSDLNGMAAKIAAAKIRTRLTEFAAHRFNVAENAVEFRENVVFAGTRTLPFHELVELAWRERIQLWASGFYKTPSIRYDRKTLSGHPFFYFAYGAAVSEVVVDTLTGEHRTLRVDILHDCGDSLNPAVDLGQIEGGFIQGAGWLTSEELWWNESGELMTHAPSTYKIPVSSDLAPDFRVQMLTNAPNREDTIYRSKAVGRTAADAGHLSFPRDSRCDCFGCLSVSKTECASDARGCATGHRGAAIVSAWIDKLWELKTAGERVAMVTVIGMRGSAPCEQGAKMIVSSNETFGTIGGGRLEYLCTDMARNLHESGTSQLIERFPLSASVGQCCGGVVDMLFEAVPDRVPELAEIAE